MYSARNPGANEQGAESSNGPLTYQTYIVYMLVYFLKLERETGILCVHMFAYKVVNVFYVFLIRKRWRRST